MLKLDQILTALPQLEPSDLRAIIAAAGELLTRPGTTPHVAENNVSAWLYEALTATLRVTYNYPVWVMTPTGKLFSRNAPSVIKFIEDNFPAILDKKVLAQAFMRWVIEMIVSDLKEINIPISTKAVIFNFSRVPSIFEKAFPGYLEANLGYKIVNAIINRENFND